MEHGLLSRDGQNRNTGRGHMRGKVRRARIEHPGLSVQELRYINPVSSNSAGVASVTEMVFHHFAVECRPRPV